jgi:hypothetical protein
MTTNYLNRSRPELSSWPRPVAVLELEVRDCEARLVMARSKYNWAQAEAIRLQLTSVTRALEQAKGATMAPDQKPQ